MVKPDVFHHKAHGELHKGHGGFFGVAILCVLHVYFAFSVVKLDGFSSQSPRRLTQSSRFFFWVRLFFVFSVSTLRSLWLSPMVFHHKAHGELHKGHGGFFGAAILCVLRVYFTFSVVKLDGFSPQSLPSVY